MPNPIKKKIDAAIKKMSEARAGKLAEKSQAARKSGEYQKSTQLANKATKVELRQMGRDIKNAQKSMSETSKSRYESEMKRKKSSNETHMGKY